MICLLVSFVSALSRTPVHAIPPPERSTTAGNLTRHCAQASALCGGGKRKVSRSREASPPCTPIYSLLSCVGAVLYLANLGLGDSEWVGDGEQLWLPGRFPQNGQRSQRAYSVRRRRAGRPVGGEASDVSGWRRWVMPFFYSSSIIIYV